MTTYTVPRTLPPGPLTVNGAQTVPLAGAWVNHEAVTEVHLTGLLVCRGDADVAVVEQHLPRHVALTRAAAGCISFEVIRDSDSSLLWRVDERFRDATAFRAHQERVAHSEWGRSTAGIERRYVTEGL